MLVVVGHRTEIIATKDRVRQLRHRLEIRGETLATDRNNKKVPATKPEQTNSEHQRATKRNEGTITFRSSPGDAMNLEPHLPPRLTFECVVLLASES